MKQDLFDKHNGFVKLARTGTEEKIKSHRENNGRDNDDQRVIDFCLNCTKKKCYGHCKELTEYMKGLKKQMINETSSIITEKHKELAEIINSYYGCDSAYFGVDNLAIAELIIKAGWENAVHCCDCSFCEVIKLRADSEEIYVCNFRYNRSRHDPTHFCGYGVKKDG